MSARSARRESRTEHRGWVPAMNGHLVDAAGAADLLGVPKSWVLAQARADRIPHVRLGRYVRFEPDELEAWWRARRRGPITRDRRVAA